MGRQKGDARTKSRPSSSSLAASLLPSESAAPTIGFGGYVGTSRFSSGGESSFSTEVDSEVSVHLKRLGRKDHTTKLKALASLSSLFKEYPGKEVVAIIPQWAFEYKRLLLDYNREVRRAANETMAILVATVGRDIAPHLKSLMGPWWFSQFDPIPEVSSAGKQSFQAAFLSQEKRLDALMYCTNEIIMYLEENLQLTPQSMSNKSTALDELEEMHQQAISSSLLALATLLDVLFCTRMEISGSEDVPAEPRNASKAKATATSLAKQLFYGHNFFVTFLKAKSPAIRSATYALLSSFIKNIPEAIDEGSLKTLAAAILGAFDEKNSVCHSSMWDAILLFSRKFPNSWMLLNVQKSVLNRLCHFLRNGCFGSQKVSYPALVLFLDVIPPKVAGQKFFLDFLHSLWAGRNQSYCSVAEQHAFFLAFQECFLWGVRNASRYCDDTESISRFRAILADEILVKLLWQEYMPSVGSRKMERVSCEMAEDTVLENSNEILHRKALETPIINYPIGVLQDLGKCVVEILSGIYIQDCSMLFSFRAAFQKSCLMIFEEAERIEPSISNLERAILFLSLLDQHAMQKSETWPLVNLVGPVWAESFATIKSFDIPDAVEFLSVVVSLFGPRKVVREFLVNSKSHTSSPLSDFTDHEMKPLLFIQVFKDTFVPWCLVGHNSSSSARIDLLLALLDDECFSEQWHTIIVRVIDLYNSGGYENCLDSGQLIVLTMLFEKVRDRIRKWKTGFSSNIQRCFHAADHWHDELLESAVVATASSLSHSSTSKALFLCAVLGGSTQGSQISFVPRSAFIVIFKEVFKKLLTFVMLSSYTSVRDSGILVDAEATNLAADYRYAKNVIGMSNFALEVLKGSLFSLEMLNKDYELVSGILALIFIVNWEHEMLRLQNDPNVEAELETKERLDFGESMMNLYCRINNHFWRSLDSNIRKRLGVILVQFVRSAIFEKNEHNTTKIATLGCTWMLEIFNCLCQDQDEEQRLLDQLLNKGDKWPVWVSQKEIVPIDDHAFGKLDFVSLIDKLIQEIGIGKVVGGYVDTASPSQETNGKDCSRAWLAAEILCTWRWPEGGAVTSFLPLLSEYLKSQCYSSRPRLIDSICNILLDAALVNGGSCTDILFCVCPALDDVVDKIDEPCLRALVALLATLLKDNVLEACEVVKLLDLVASKLLNGKVVNQNCLRILPLIVTSLVRSACQKSIIAGQYSRDDQFDSFGENQIQDTIEGWVQKALLLPAVVTGQEGQDVQSWLRLILSCYPLNATGTLKLERNISSVERMLILDLYRKQRSTALASQANNLLPEVQLLLSKLMIISVGYCWMEFIEEDWEFFFFHLRLWVQSAVVMMEEVAEKVNDAITESFTCDNSSVILKNLEQTVLTPDHLLINVANNALASFLLFCQQLGLQQPQDGEKTELLLIQKFTPIKDRIIEGILRIFFCTGIVEAIASSYCDEAASIVSSSRLEHLYFWELVGSNVVNSSVHARDRAVKSLRFWGLTKGPIESLYAILFSTISIPSLKIAAYVVLTTEPVSRLDVILNESSSSSLDAESTNDLDSSGVSLLSEKNIRLKDEISCIIEKPPSQLLEMDLESQERVNLLLAWSLLLSHLSSVPLSPAREHLVQYLLECADPVILYCIFQHIPLDSDMSHNQRKKDAERPAATSAAADAAACSISTGSLLFAVETLWPVDDVKMGSLAGALLGLMLRILPAYVRGWFMDLRDRYSSIRVESFVKSSCSPRLIQNELLQIKKVNIADENLAVSVSKSTNEVVATYKKDETSMCLFIRLPESYPLLAVDIDGSRTRSLGISELKSRKWQMSLASFLRNQNGALAEAVQIWKRNVDREFEGVEDCPICYSIIHTADHSVPRLACRTCKHKFHKACIYKWVSVSHKSKCPLCQSEF